MNETLYQTLRWVILLFWAAFLIAIFVFNVMPSAPLMILFAILLVGTILLDKYLTTWHRYHR